MFLKAVRAPQLLRAFTLLMMILRIYAIAVLEKKSFNALSIFGY